MKSGDTVTICSKLPFPLIMELQESHKVAVEVFGGGTREVLRHSKTGKRFTLKGCAYDRGAPLTREIVHGAALTHGVPREFAEEWFKQNAGNPIVMNDLVFAANNGADAKAKAREHKDDLSGFEPLNPRKIPDEFKSIQAETKVDVEED